MYTFLSIVYVLVCLFLVFVVLLQPGRGGGMGSSFGGGSSNTVFGASGAGNFLTRLTTASAALFMLLSVVLAYMSSGSDKSLEKASAAAKSKQEAKAKQDAKKGKETLKGSASDVQIEGMSPGSDVPIKLEQVDPSELPGAGEPAAPAVPALVPVDGKAAPVEPAAPAEPAPLKPASKPAERVRAPVEAKPAAPAPAEAPAAAPEPAPAPAAPATP